MMGIDHTRYSSHGNSILHIVAIQGLDAFSSKDKVKDLVNMSLDSTADMRKLEEDQKTYARRMFGWGKNTAMCKCLEPKLSVKKKAKQRHIAAFGHFALLTVLERERTSLCVWPEERCYSLKKLLETCVWQIQDDMQLKLSCNGTIILVQKEFPSLKDIRTKGIGQGGVLVGELGGRRLLLSFKAGVVASLSQLGCFEEIGISRGAAGSAFHGLQTTVFLDLLKFVCLFIMEASYVTDPAELRTVHGLLDIFWVEQHLCLAYVTIFVCFCRWMQLLLSSLFGWHLQYLTCNMVFTPLLQSACCYHWRRKTGELQPSVGSGLRLLLHVFFDFDVRIWYGGQSEADAKHNFQPNDTCEGFQQICLSWF
ncbi:hypothetical protein SELMODRAFT_418131 [Selaginella moellendorffii]|uniref:Uncharacterized protein n=1 Tax=Selaginella moellendorffii TaxID=88036 RepID=D8S4S5_SELML|nr:hypothetical protein SELMODRAFT_418131 [Selaginella moellendorffii]